MKFKHSSSKKILLFVSILNIVALACYLFLFNEVKNKNETASVLASNLNKKIIEESSLKIANNFLEETYVEREKINSYFVRGGKSGVAKFVENIENMSNLSNVLLKVNSIIVKDQEEKDIIEEIKLSFTVKGDWNEVIHFLNLLNLAPYKISFDKTYLEKESTEDSLKWEGLFNITVLKLSDN